jgi:NADH:ubiquinone oxidoreductase subunit
VPLSAGFVVIDKIEIKGALRAKPRMTIGTLLYTWLRGERVGSDSFGNRYYRDSRKRVLKRGGGRDSRERRWVIYRGEAEASKVPPEWHGWLHHTVDEMPVEGAKPLYPWQKPHQPNLTGTPEAYRPPGSLLKGGTRERAAGDYEPWRPE